ncbi:hypothetical protein [Komagataeibacter sp. FNDCF1]|uniref:hypothetical protein n=1 Tax=Komagataeibacter sp. FNDCF1 TaxID=2878681 RepID=UPI001E5F03DE|nr:hypothetical protein [Komagataeibacter sp. FNDCF1]MCE2565393.1 hypothetical protein [Komagataeibacter sp. FNDCF1]
MDRQMMKKNIKMAAFHDETVIPHPCANGCERKQVLSLLAMPYSDLSLFPQARAA